MAAQVIAVAFITIITNLSHATLPIQINGISTTSIVNATITSLLAFLICLYIKRL